MKFVKRKVKIENEILLVDKPVDWTSHDVVAKVKGELGGKVKVGHGGTLDPFATGVLLILIGKATSKFEEIKTWDKEYVMEVQLGELTDTGDKTGKVIETARVGKVQRDKLEQVLKGFKGGYLQEVPMYSAVKVKGKKLYQLAYKGKIVKRPKRIVKIKKIELVEFKGDVFKVQVRCGSGTYMRQLAVDVGKKLKLPAHAKSLHRTRVGEYIL